MKNYPHNFADAPDPNEIEDVYNGPDPDQMNLVYGGPDNELTECVYAGPEYFRNGNVFEPEPSADTIGCTIAEGAKRVKETAKKK